MQAVRQAARSSRADPVIGLFTRVYAVLPPEAGLRQERPRQCLKCLSRGRLNQRQ
ncbi:hypothetical protein E4U11_004834 [Claviceps purpurea]|nr:hypothetical protein E4U11_004834 [Claviceps purpurea]